MKVETESLAKAQEELHNRKDIGALIREIVFGMEDGMVSTLGAVTGIAVGSGNRATVILAGVVIVAVESVSMGIGSYLSNRSEEEVNKQSLQTQRKEIIDDVHTETEELFGAIQKDGWPKDIARIMADTAAKDSKLMLKEKAYRELSVIPSRNSKSLRNAIAMYFSYVIGGAIPLIPYLVLGRVASATPISVVITLIGLFALGAIMTAYTRISWYKSGARMLALGGIALVIGYVIGDLASQF